MFERFTDRARRVVVLAQEEARKLNHNYIGTEHLLLGLIRESEGVAAKALESLGISLDAVRQQVREIIGQGQQPPSGHIPFTKRAKKALELSTRESMQLGHNYIGTEHILLGLLREGDGVAAQVLVKLGADLNLVRQQVIQLLHGSGKGGRAPGCPMTLSRGSTRWTIAWRRSNAGQACDLTWASWSRRSRRCAGRRKPRSTGRISRRPPRRATRRSSCLPPGPTGRRSGPRPLLAARRWPANWAG